MSRDLVAEALLRKFDAILEEAYETKPKLAPPRLEWRGPSFKEVGVAWIVWTIVLVSFVWLLFFFGTAKLWW